VLLHDLRNVFSGFETFDPNNRRQTMEQALRIIENLDVLIAADQALNVDRIELPSPPPVIAQLVGETEKKLRQEARSQIERLRAERNKHHAIRRQPAPPPRPVKKGPPGAESPKETADREHLVFNVGRDQSSEQARAAREAAGQRPAKESGDKAGAAQPHHKTEPGGGRRKHWHGRRRPHRPKP
jgi:hypothetical protein